MRQKTIFKKTWICAYCGNVNNSNKKTCKVCDHPMDHKIHIENYNIGDYNDDVINRETGYYDNPDDPANKKTGIGHILNEYYMHIFMFILLFLGIIFILTNCNL